MFAAKRSLVSRSATPNENHFLMNAPEVSEQQLSKHGRQDGDRAIERTTEINDSGARVDEDRADLFTPYWMYLENGARHRSLSIIATLVPLFYRTKFRRTHSRTTRVCFCGTTRAVALKLLRNVFQRSAPAPSHPPSTFCRVVADTIDPA